MNSTHITVCLGFLPRDAMHISAVFGALYSYG